MIKLPIGEQTSIAGDLCSMGTIQGTGTAEAIHWLARNGAFSPDPPERMLL